MIEVLSDFPENVVAVACHGQVTREDYENVLVPRVEHALARNDKVHLYYEVAPDFKSIEPGAMWEDFKVGFAHLSRWDRIAVVTDIDWIGNTIKAFSFVMPAEVRVFPTQEAQRAKAWISSDETQQ
jgi:hypothetical protein